MTRPFKVGDKVLCIRESEWPGIKGQQYIIENIVGSGDMMSLRLSNLGPAVAARRFKLVEHEKLDLSRTVVTRGGLLVSNVRLVEDERPVRATVRIEGVTRELSYDLNGAFIVDQQCPVDLINQED